MSSNAAFPFAYVTMLTNDQYLVGALTLAQSLREAVSAWSCVVLITDEVTEASRAVLHGQFEEVINVSTVAGRSLEGLKMIDRPDLFATLTKLQLWGLVQYERVLYLDADTLVLQNLDHLFRTEPADAFAAVPELGYPDCFNTGMMLLSPSKHTLSELLKFARTEDSFDGGDQGLLNMYFGDGAVGAAIRRCMSPQELSETGSVDYNSTVYRPWHRLSYSYNVQTNAAYRMYIGAVRRYEALHKVVHFVGKDKPWHYAGTAASETTSHYSKFYAEMVGKWHAINARIPR